jgi:hypothetical protein
VFRSQLSACIEQQFKDWSFVGRCIKEITDTRRPWFIGKISNLHKSYICIKVTWYTVLGIVRHCSQKNTPHVVICSIGHTQPIFVFYLKICRHQLKIWWLKNEFADLENENLRCQITVDEDKSSNTLNIWFYLFNVSFICIYNPFVL